MKKITVSSKVINDRIEILNSFIAKTAFSNEGSDKYHRDEAVRAKDLFEKLKLAIEKYAELYNKETPGDSDALILEALTDNIKELAGSTMVPLVERNKQTIETYKQQIFNFSQRKIELEEAINIYSGDGPKPAEHSALVSELNEVDIMMLKYDGIKKDTVEYLDEYELALEEIKSLVTVDVLDIIENTANEITPEETMTFPSEVEDGGITFPSNDIEDMGGDDNNTIPYRENSSDN